MIRNCLKQVKHDIFMSVEQRSKYSPYDNRCVIKLQLKPCQCYKSVFFLCVHGCLVCTLFAYLPQCPIYASMNWVNIGSGNGLLPVQHQPITWNNVDLLSIEPSGTSFSEIQVKIQYLSFMKMWSAKWQPFCPGGDGLYVIKCKALFLVRYCGFIIARLILGLHPSNEKRTK